MSNLIPTENILINQAIADRDSAIEAAGSKLVEIGAVTQDYIQAMKEREAIVSTYMGNFLAIPHGTDEAKSAVLKSGIVLIQAPEGIDWDGNEVKVVVGIAGKDGEHLDLLSQIAIVFSEEENVERVINAQSAEEINAIFNEVEL
ncbi:PTS sugar transporter subunit IIA [Macrococcoides canis]|uniref:Mannitol-specific phosphotransferase enzyme IIA component n=1 Tax=Macrococcoides canis TaxID=1855823 RepID=A0A1W7A9S0_9STAP|nr:PTS sugar transporter subunit IIA [Macrococcus canis]ARQ06156.1 Mannitol-specific phosphotransferase enzyme IIA component [Macrococcus canis]MCO4097078.1 PTS sugar transporter subunit IIA [Macrococcus canis]QIH75167.1 PTS transporter subunit EIIA [Macrococcus canis]QNR07119.1 PTS mannitol transporter subunit IIA [Macrococcus canis]QTQ08550.1 PTS sugar transporter subunit IIA [Macrococcus canis]